MVLISAAVASQARVLHRASLTHTFTRTPVTDGTEDAWGEAAQTDGTPVTGRPCRYKPEDRLIIDERGRQTVSVPTLRLRSDETIAVGDKVSAVTDADGVVLLAGPLIVETVEPGAAVGGTLYKVALLREAVTS